MSSTTASLRDHVEEWGRERVRLDDVPSEETLEEIQRGISAFGEFAIEPLKAALRRVADDASRNRGQRIPPEARYVTYGEVGQLVAFADRMREEIKRLLDDVHEIGFITRDQLVQAAAGYDPLDVAHTPDTEAWWKQFYGLTAETLEPRGGRP